MVLVCENNEGLESSDVEFKKLSYKAFYYGTQTDLLKLENQTPEDLKSINFGLAMHYMLEMLGEFNRDSVQHAKDMMINKYGYSLEDSEISDIERRVLMMLESEEFISLASGEYYKEKALRYKNNLRYIDLLVKQSDGSWTVIDYKSSMSYSDKHIQQVNYYVKAIKEITGEEVKGYIVYLLQDSVKVTKV